MKPLFLCILLAGISIPALAVSTKDCPARLEIEINGLRVDKSFDAVWAETDQDEAKAQAIRDALLKMKELNGESRLWPLTQAKNGRCVYTVGEDQEKAEIYSSKGVDRVYFQIVAGEKGILLRAYAEILNLSPKKVSIKEAPASIALAIPRRSYDSYLAGGSLVFVGTAEEPLSLIVK